MIIRIRKKKDDWDFVSAYPLDPYMMPGFSGSTDLSAGLQVEKRTNVKKPKMFPNVQ